MDENSGSTIVRKSVEFLKVVLSRKPNVFDLVNYFERLPKKTFVELLNEDKMVVWLNLYNAFVQIEIEARGPGELDKDMFTEELFTVAGEHISLDMIEHGILRGNKWKYGLGYVPGGQLPGRIRHWRCKRPDPRIHFLLNCGAASCPVIRIITEENLHDELKQAEEDYLNENVVIEEDNNILSVPGLMRFYLGDFGGTRGIKSRIGLYKEVDGLKMRFEKFDWSPMPYKIKGAY